MNKIINTYFTVIVLLISTLSIAQKETINWLSFEQLEAKFIKTPKKVVIHFYANWCVYCKKMEQDVYTKPEIIKVINNNFYAVKFNAESTDTINFGGQTFKNLNIGKQRSPNHQIAEYLASQKDKGIVLPATVIFDESFEIKKRFFTYLAPKLLHNILTH